MADFSLDLNEDQLQIQKWVHDFAEDVVRPAAHEWDEREETPWPIIEEAAKIGLYSMEFGANAVADPTGLTWPIVSEEMCWGDAGITLAIFGSTLAVSGIIANGTPEQIGEWVPQCFGTPEKIATRRVLRERARCRQRRRARCARAPSTTRRRTSGCSTAPRRGSPTAASPTCTSWWRRSTPSSRGAARPASSCRRARPGLRMGQKFKKHGIRASHTAEVVLDDVRVPGELPPRRQGEARRAPRPRRVRAGAAGARRR